MGRWIVGITLMWCIAPGSAAAGPPKDDATAKGHIEVARGCLLDGKTKKARTAATKAQACAVEEAVVKEANKLVHEAEYRYGREEEVKHEQEVKLRENCKKHDVLCVSADGQGYAGDHLPTFLLGGSHVQVVVLGCVDAYRGSSFEISSSTVPDGDRLQPDDGSEAGKGNIPAMVPSTDTCDAPPNLRSICTSENNIRPLVRKTLAVPSNTNDGMFAIHIVRNASDDGAIPAENSSHSTAIQRGRYFLDLGVLVPVVIGGSQEVVALPSNRTPEVHTLQERRRPGVHAAVALHIFPAGRELGRFSAAPLYMRCRDDHLADDTKGSCREEYARRFFANALGLELAVDANLTDFTRSYLGAFFEPIAGFGLSAGVALTQVQTIAEGVRAGRVVDPDDFARFTEQRLAPRLYLGVTLSGGIIRALVAFAKSRG